MEKEYLILRNGKQDGPFSLNDLKSKILTPDTMVKTSEYDWTEIKFVAELRGMVTESKPSRTSVFGWTRSKTGMSIAAAGMIVAGVGGNEAYKDYQQERSDKLIFEEKCENLNRNLFEIKNEIGGVEDQIKNEKNTASEFERRKNNSSARLTALVSDVEYAQNALTKAESWTWGRSSEQRTIDVSRAKDNLSAAQKRLADANAEIANSTDAASNSRSSIDDLKEQLKHLKTKEIEIQQDVDHCSKGFEASKLKK